MSKIRTIGVSFDQTRRMYHYLTDQDAKIGDYAMVDANGTVTTVLVRTVSNIISDKATKFALAVVNRDMQEERHRKLEEMRRIDQEIEDRIEFAKQQRRIKDALAEDTEGQALLEQRRALEESLLAK